MNPISVFIITKNEEDRIEKIILAIKKIANEIIVIDSGSSDKTREISESLGAKVIYNQWQGYGQQKIFGENQCKNNWILNIDADEELSPELSAEIEEIFSKNIDENIAGFKIKIVNKFRFENKPHKFAYYYNQFRLYRKDLAGFNNSTVHDSVYLKNKNIGKIINLKNIIYHQSFRDFKHWIDKINSYSSMQAIDAVQRKKSANYLKIFISPSVAFFKAYLVRRYFIYGLDGLIYSYLYAFSRFAKMIKIREQFKEKNN
jgi:glycosyltransferase involved in cell wall biosynthesis